MRIDSPAASPFPAPPRAEADRADVSRQEDALTVASSPDMVQVSDAARARVDEADASTSSVPVREPSPVVGESVIVVAPAKSPSFA